LSKRSYYPDFITDTVNSEKYSEYSGSCEPGAKKTAYVKKLPESKKMLSGLTMGFTLVKND